MKLATAALLLLSLPAYAEPVHHVLTVHDGDSIRTLEDGAIRFSGIDAPEIGYRARCAREDALANAARDYVAMRLHDGVILRRRPGERDVEKYGRELRWVFAPDGGDVGEELIAKGYAVPYHGRGARMDWCSVANEAHPQQE